MGLLEIPLQSAAVERERDDGIGEEVDAGPLRTVAERVCHAHLQQAEFGIDLWLFPDSTAVSFAADPRRACNVPALILFVLRDCVEMPEHLACFRINCEYVATWNVAFAARRTDIEHAVVELRR